MRIRDGTFVGILFIFVIILFIVHISYDVNEAYNHRKVFVTVTDKGMKRSWLQDKDEYLIYGVTTASDKSVVFKITDNLFALRFNSSDVYAGIEIGATYCFTVGGYRIPVISKYPNIFACKKIDYVIN